MALFIPREDAARISWLNNFKHEFPIVAAAYGFDAAEINKVKAACETLVFSINLARAAKRFSKVCTAYRNANVKLHRRAVEQIPEFVMPEAPATLAPTDALSYLQEIARRIKVQSKYTTATGALLAIVTPKARRPTRDEAAPDGKAVALANSVVRLDWVKKGFEGVIVESKRGDETAWTELNRDFQSPYIDTRPPLVAQQPEQRFYRLIYLADDQPYGKYSKPIQAVTNP